MKKILLLLCPALCSMFLHASEYISYMSSIGPYEISAINYESFVTQNHVYTKKMIHTYEEEALHDKDTFKNALTVFYPETFTKRPLVIISHGWGDSKKSQASLAQYLASHGYIAIIFSGQDCIYPHHFLTAIQEAYIIIKKAVKNPKSHLYNKVDMQTVAIIGHSMGGTAALHHALDNSTIKAVIALNPYNGSSNLIELVGGKNDILGSDLSRMHVPTLIITGSNDKLALPEKSFIFCKKFNKTTPLAFFSIKDGKHAHAVDKVGIEYTGTFNPEKHSLYRILVLSWLELFMCKNTLPASFLFLNNHHFAQFKAYLHSNDENSYPPFLLQNLNTQHLQK